MLGRYIAVRDVYDFVDTVVVTDVVCCDLCLLSTVRWLATGPGVLNR